MTWADQARKGLNLLPKKLRHELLRRSFKLSYEWPSDLQFKLATTPLEFEAAFRLIHDCYVQAGWLEPDPTGLFILPQHLLPQSALIVAILDRRVVGTATIIRDNPMGLLSDAISDFSSFRAKGQRIGELACLAVDPEFRKGLSRIFLPLLKFAYHYGHDSFGIRRVLVSVHPSALELYEAILGMELLPEKPMTHPLFKGEPLHVMSAELDRYLERLSDLYSGHTPSTDLSHFFGARIGWKHFRLPDPRFHHATNFSITPKLMKELFLEKGKLGDRLSGEQRRILSQQYFHPNFTSVLAALGPAATCSRSEGRIDTRLSARVGLSRHPSEVWDASSGGLRLASPESLQVGKRVDLRVQINRSRVAHLEAEVRWISDSSMYGLRIERSDSAWSDMLNSLKADLETVASVVSLEGSESRNLA